MTLVPPGLHRVTGPRSGSYNIGAAVPSKSSKAFLLEGDVGILPALGIAVLALGGPVEPREAAITIDVDSLADTERPVRGTVTTRCASSGSLLDFDLSGLEPNGRYSVWVFLFDRPRGMVVPDDAVAAGALGGHGTRHEFDADRSGRARLVVLQRPGPLSSFGAVGGCLLDLPQWRVVGGLHPRGVRAGVYMPPPGDIVAQFGITYRKP